MTWSEATGRNCELDSVTEDKSWNLWGDAEFTSNMERLSFPMGANGSFMEALNRQVTKDNAEYRRTYREMDRRASARR